ncbi:MAG TPA: hypothetical protein VFH60_01015 [Chloroflexia bacterium]|nr:hypothetical protein [Chloroflexia bacterium]
MATITANPGSSTAASPRSAATTQDRRVARLRSWMLAMISAALAFGVLAGLVAWQANLATYNEYHTIVDEGAVSVDAALLARAAALDHMSAAATYLETEGAEQQQARAFADSRWDVFTEQARISWRNVTDPTHGELNVFSAADDASHDYIQQIGAMFGYEETGQRDRAGDAFLAARETMNTRLVPALGGLEAVKVEKMEATYAGADQRINNWRNVSLFVGGLLALIFLGMLLAVRRMHYRWSWSIGAAFIATVLLTAGMQWHLLQASSDARVLVREAYDNVAGVQDMAALLSQQRALDSIIVFDPAELDRRLADFDKYHTLVEQRLCGPRDCTQAGTFLSNNDRISPLAVKAAQDEQDRLDLPRMPLVATVYFRGQADVYEQIRQDYRAWLVAHETLVEHVRANRMAEAAAASSGESATTYAQLQQRAAEATQIARNEFNNIWQRVYTLTGLGQVLALTFPLAGALAAWGLSRRRGELML